jgi:hypothetical protein
MFARSIFAAGLLTSAMASPYFAYPAYQPVAQMAPAYYDRYTSYAEAADASLAAQKLYDDLKQLDTDTAEIGKMVEAFQGDANAALQVQAASDKLAKDIKKALSNVNKDGVKVYPVQDSINLLPIFDTFIPDTNKALEGLVAKKALFDKISVSSVVFTSVKQQKELGTKLNDAIYAKLPAIAKPIDKKQWGAINAALDKAIAAYGVGQDE